MNIYAFNSKYTDKLELIRKVLTLNTMVKYVNGGDDKFRPMLINVMSFYCIYGYNDETKDLVIDSLNINRKNLNQINSQLTKAGYLVKDTRNYKRKNLSKEMEAIVDYFVKDDTRKEKLMMIKFDVR